MTDPEAPDPDSTAGPAATPVAAAASAPLRRTALHALHSELGARMVPFAGYDMPVQYPSGILAEHKHTRQQAGLFDVSHMGQMRITGADPAGALERLVPGDILALAPGRMRYTQLTNERGGIHDDLMVTRREDHLFLVVNAGCKDADYALLRAGLPDCTVERLDDRALLALQGPAALGVLTRLVPAAASLGFMTGAALTWAGAEIFVTRSGYTGEDGVEISVPALRAEALAQLLLAEPEVKPAGLGARDSLRLEAGLCLYGHDIDENTTPVEAGLAWSIAKRRRSEGGFPGAETVQRQLAEGVTRKRVGVLPEGRAPARDGSEIQDRQGRRIGLVTSGGFAPSLNIPIAMGYVETGSAAIGTPVQLLVRGKALPGRIAAMPFVPHHYAKA